MSKDKDKEKDKDAGGGKKGGKGKLIIIVVALLVAVGGGAAGGYFFFSPSTPEAEPAPEPGIVVPLEAVTINLAEGHYLKLKFSLQATAEVAEAPDGSKALDIAIDLFSNRSIAELASNDERKRMKRELAEKVEKAYEDEIMDVYFTEFVMQ